jgi:hypothetical protein
MVKRDSKAAVLLLLVPKASRVVLKVSQVVVLKVSPVVLVGSPVVVRLDSLLAAVMMVVDSILLMLMISLSISLPHLVVEVEVVVVEWEVCPEEAWEVCQAVDIHDVKLVSPKSPPPSSVLFYFH